MRSSMKSPRCESSSSPIGVSSEMGSCAILRTLRTLATGDVHAAGDLFRGGFAAKLLHELTAGADELVDGLDHVDWDTDGAGLVPRWRG